MDVRVPQSFPDQICQFAKKQNQMKNQTPQTLSYPSKSYILQSWILEGRFYAISKPSAPNRQLLLKGMALFLFPLNHVLPPGLDGKRLSSSSKS